MNEVFLINPTEFWDQFDERISKLSIREEKTPIFLRSADVRVLLNISDSTLQTYRINGTIPAYKLGTTWLYKQDEIINVLESNKIGGRDNND